MLAIDAPQTGANVSSSFLVGGWAIDLRPGSGPGVNLIHVWAYPTSGAAQILSALPPTVFRGLTSRRHSVTRGSRTRATTRASGRSRLGLTTWWFGLEDHHWHVAINRVVRVTVR